MRTVLSKTDQQDIKSVTYRSILGSLIYLSRVTCPDMPTILTIFRKYQSDLSMEGWKAIKHLLRYLKSLAQFGILIPTYTAKPGLMAESDADWARDKSKRRSRSGYKIQYNRALVSCTSKLQTTTAFSSSKATFSGLSWPFCEIGWLRKLFGKVLGEQLPKTTIYQDNLGCINWTEHVKGLRLINHVILCYYYVRSDVELDRQNC